jgi:transcription elongation GreA/GreB family factor
MDLSQILSDCMVFEKNMCKDNEISFGATVQFTNCDTDEVKIFTIVSVYESDISKNLISIEAPFVRSMLGLKIGDYFEFNDNEYIINDIRYDLLED